MKKQRSHYIIIPAIVRYDNRLPNGAKLLFGDICALTNKFGYCFATNGYFAEVFSFAAFPLTVMYFSTFKIMAHNPNMLTLAQFEKFCEKHDYTVPEETSFVAKMLSTQSRLGTLHAKMVADIYASKSSSSEMEMAEKTS